MRRLAALALCASMSGGCGGTDTRPLDASAADDASSSDASSAPDASLGCTSAMAGFPRPLGLPEPAPNGVFDPDIVRGTESGRLWISYSAVDGAPGRGRVSTHLAWSDDEGATWCYAGEVNPAEIVSLDALPVGVTGTSAHWSHETSALVHDPGAAPDARWRLVWHRYLHVDDPASPDGRRFQYGWIAERHAATPESLRDAPERKLFGTLAYRASASVQAYNDAAPGGTPALQLETLPGLESCLVATEPALLAAAGSLYVALYCASSATEASVVLLRLDHASETWSYVGTLISNADASAIDASYTGLNAADLFVTEGQTRLLLTPTTMDRYRGCLVFGVDLASATLRDETGDGADVVFGLPLGDSAAAPFGGACTYVEGAPLGLVYGEVLPASTPAFSLTASGTTAL